MSDHALGHPEKLDDHDDHDGVVERREMIASLERFIVKYYGERCEAVQGGCPRCAIWAARDVLNATIFE